MLSTTTNGRSTGHTILIALGWLVLAGGLVCVVLGFAGFMDAQDDLSGASDDRSMALFAGGGLAMVAGLGIVAFTRASAMTRGGAYSRVTIEQGVRPPSGDGRYCPSCGTRTDPGARYCESCGVGLS